jgi:ABC-type proline/glycine betaine transport system permease subunit
LTLVREKDVQSFIANNILSNGFFRDGTTLMGENFKKKYGLSKACDMWMRLVFAGFIIRRTMMIPLTGLGKTTAILVLTVYNQYLLLNNFISGLNEVDQCIVDAATGMGMTKMQILFKIRLPLSIKALFAGIRLAVVSTIGIATIAASINAGGLGAILFDGLRTMNVNKILWGSILAAGLAIAANALLSFSERKFSTMKKEGGK